MTTIRPKWFAANSMSWVIAITVRPVAADGVDDRADPADARVVLAGRRLVEDEHRRLHRQDARQRDELPQRQVEVIGVREPRAGQPDRVECRVHGPRGRVRATTEVARPEGDLALDRPVEELVVGVLEHEPDPRREPMDRLARRCRRRRSSPGRRSAGAAR